MPPILFAYIAAVPVAVVALWFLWSFNRFVRQRNSLREAWSGIDVQLKRRHDLVPSLVECVKGYRAHERSLLERLTEVRSIAQSAQGVPETTSAENALSQSLCTLLAVAEAYPDLKGDQSFRQLSESLVVVEEQIQYARRYYNGVVQDYNTRVESCPSRIVAKLLGFPAAGFFEVELALERKASEVQL
jgi:LemA protein